MLAKLHYFGNVCSFSLVKRKTDIENSSLENIGNIIILTSTSTEKSIHPLYEGTMLTEFQGERGIYDYGKTLEGFP